MLSERADLIPEVGDTKVSLALKLLGELLDLGLKLRVFGKEYGGRRPLGRRRLHHERDAFE